METIRILLADDHPLFRDGMKALLATLPDCEVMGEATTGEQAIALAQSLQSDIVLMDLQMPQSPPNWWSASRPCATMSPISSASCR